MKKQNVLILSILTLINLTLFGANYFLKVQNYKESSSNTSIINSDEIESNFEAFYLYNNTFLPQVKLLDLKGDTISNFENLFDKAILIFRYSDINCSNCVNLELDRILKLSLKIPIVLTVSYNRMRDLAAFIRAQKIKNQIYICDNTDLVFNNKLIPGCFILENGKVFDIFYPKPENNELTIKYLSYVENKYD